MRSLKWTAVLFDVLLELAPKILPLADEGHARQ
jgi:hypothetical protein